MFRERKPGVRWVLPDGQYNPVVAEGVRWLDYERAAGHDLRTDRDHRTGDREPGPDRDQQSGRDQRANRDHQSGRDQWADPDHQPERPDMTHVTDMTHLADTPGDLLDAEEGDWFERTRRPSRLADSRPYGVPGGLAQPDPQVEQDLAEALRPGDRFPDPRGTWVRLINGGGPADDPFRASNAADCALAVLSTWHGEPATAAPRFPEYDRIGRPLLTGEEGSLARIERWVGQRFQYAGQGRHAYPMIARRLRDAGHGAAAVIVVRWPGGGSHAWNAVNYDGEVIWIDAQRGHMSVEPAYMTVTGVFCVILDRQGWPR
ncbi:toxin glutamine deamidase domain-containing protein [Nonomuraea jabiensis]|uniref:toxin glutamine deamidase domain-containing protein n=1 Tax=Nonomuraea jabiensis TaxID=882448 RepID=UPI003D726FA1